MNGSLHLDWPCLVPDYYYKLLKEKVDFEVKNAMMQDNEDCAQEQILHDKVMVIGSL